MPVNSVKDLVLGDILITVGHYDTGSHVFLNGGQAAALKVKQAASAPFVLVSHCTMGSEGMALPRRDTSLCHAMIAVGNGNVAEAVSAGISINPLETNHSYKVFRYFQPGYGHLVAATAWGWARPEAGTGGKYRYVGCATGPVGIASLGILGKRQVDKMAQRINEPLTPKDRMVCTEFAILCWNATFKQSGFEGPAPIQLDARSCSPMELNDCLEHSEQWTCEGTFRHEATAPAAAPTA
jgi:hypothetical protein